MICAVIPTYNSETSLPALLSSLSSHVDRIVVTDGKSNDLSFNIAAKHGAMIALGTPGRGNQLRRGVHWAAECEWVLILHADSRLPENWQALTTRHIKKYPDKAGYFDLRFNSQQLSARIIERLVRIRCSLFGLPYGDQGLLISKTLYDEVGGYPATSLFEDVAIIKALGKPRIKRLGGPLMTDASKFERDGFLRRGWRNFRLLRRYLKGETPESIARDYT